MNYLLDTCVLSEFTARLPDERVVSWLNGQAEEHLCISSITIGELKRGVERLPASPRKERLQSWLAIDILERFSGRILAADTFVMLQWGTLRAQLDAAGRPVSPVDSIIAAIALAHHMPLVTRNVKDFAHTGVQLINPWQESRSES